MIIFMKRIIVFSDTHGNIDMCCKVIDRLPCDMILHAGDYADDAQRLKQMYPDKIIKYVKGNCDIFSYAPAEEIVKLDGVNIFLTHGHMHRVKYDPEYAEIARAAKAKGCDAAVFGHTHIEYSGERDGIKLLNPGSVRYGGTYGVIEIEDGKPSVCFVKGESSFVGW